jgi:ATP phosphoribosyltransferase regulatory subunit HisZ
MMVYEHEIPSKSKLYFGSSAKKKRELESIGSEFLYQNGFEEIVTPLLSYHQHQGFADSKQLIKLKDENNFELTLRADSTIDVVRIITKRLGRTTNHKKWFYIQPVVTYPTVEHHQLGAEVIDGKFEDLLCLSMDLMQKLGKKPLLQVSNIVIPNLLNAKYGISLELLKLMEIESLQAINYPWLKGLIRLQRVEEVDALLAQLPDDIAQELLKLKQSVSKCAYENIVLSPLYYAKMQYYEGLTFRAFEQNSVLIRGGEYIDENIKAAGFTIYLDEILKDF